MDSKIKKIAGLAEDFIGYLVIMAICIVTYGVIARMFNVSTAWTDELLRAIFIWLIFTGSAVAYKTGNLISLDLVEEMLQKFPVPLKILRAIQYVCGLIFGIFMTSKMYIVVSTQFSTSELTPVLQIPLWSITLGCLVGGIMFLLFSLQKLYRLFVTEKSK